MPWLLVSPEHQQPWYWICRINRSLPSTRKWFYLPVPPRQEMQIYFLCFFRRIQHAKDNKFWQLWFSTHTCIFIYRGNLIHWIALTITCTCMLSYLKKIKFRRLSVRLQCLVHPSVRDKCWVSEIDLSQTRHETAFWWRHNGPVTSQLTDPIKWPNYPLDLIGIYVHINTHNKESMTQRCRSTNVFDIFIYIYMDWALMDGMPYFTSQITVTASP